MPINLKIFLLMLGLLGILIILSMARRKKMMLRHAIFWQFLIVFVMIATLFIEPLKGVATFIGIEEVSNMIFLGGFIILLCISLLLTSTVSKQKLALIKLTQELAITNHKIEEISNERSNRTT